MNKPEECRHWNYCNAPICPILNDDEALWYPDEEICRYKRDVPRWVRIQRRIAKVTGKDNSRGYFTLRMLKLVGKIKRGVCGINPDSDDAEKLINHWCMKRKQWSTKPEDVERRHRHSVRVGFQAKKS